MTLKEWSELVALGDRPTVCAECRFHIETVKGIMCLHRELTTMNLITGRLNPVDPLNDGDCPLYEMDERTKRYLTELRRAKPRPGLWKRIWMALRDHREED